MLRRAGALLTVAAATFAEDLQPSMAPIAQRIVQLNDTALPTATANGATVKTVRVPGAPWMRVSFKHSSLRNSAGLKLRLTSVEDGKFQLLNATTIAQWYYTSAYFNGDAVTVTYEGAGTVEVEGAVAGEPAGEVDTICGSHDDRKPSHHARAARYMGSGGCSGWLINDQHHCFLTAGHCGTNSQGSGTMEFNVPQSSSSGAIRHPGPEDQYPVDRDSVQSANGGVGNDWMYLGTFPNSNTGKTAYEVQRDAYDLTTDAPSQGHFSQIIGYGTTSPRNHLSQTQQEDDGEQWSASGSTARYRVDTTGGNSGSGVERAQRLAYAIHTHGGCGSSSTSSNAGTLLSNNGLQAALQNPKGVCR